MTRVMVFVLITLLYSTTFAGPYSGYNDFTKYDRHFSKYSKRFFGVYFNWLRFKSQAIAESNLNKDAVSPVGAIGVMQIMPSTFNEIISKQRIIKGFSTNPKWNIAAGIYYDRQMWNIWTSERPFQDRLDFMYASYNAGAGNIIKAQKKVDPPDNPNLWVSIEGTLHIITGHNSKETIEYVKRIKEIQKDLGHKKNVMYYKLRR